MCGIIAYLGQKTGTHYTLEGIKMLRNRGYDSMGCCSILKNQFQLTKFATQTAGAQDSYALLEQAFDRHQTACNLIAHCRWATTGRVTDQNSHPHIDTVTESIALVHNGIISNYLKLKTFLTSQQVIFKSETDSEVIVNLIGYYYNQNHTLSDAIKLTLQELEGTWALVIIDKNAPDCLYVCKKGSPILIGYSDDMCIVSSETSGFSNYLKNYHIVGENRLLKIQLEAKGELKFFIDDHLTQLSTKTLIQQSLFATSPAPYAHWTIKEIMEQPDAVQRALNGGGRLLDSAQVKLGGLTSHQAELLAIKHLVILASGTSAHAGMLGLKYFQMLSGFETIRVFDAAEFLLEDLTTNGAGVLCLSQSGETRDILACIEQIRQHRPDVLVFAAVNVVESAIARAVDCGVYLNAGREVGVASTKSFTNQVVVLLLMAIWFAQNRKINYNLRVKAVKSLHNIPLLLKKVLMELELDKMVDYLLDYKSLFILGNNLNLPIALEGALKIKEISYIHAEAYATGSLKHGPLALIETGTPVIALRNGDYQKIDIAIQETQSRGAQVFVITDQAEFKLSETDLKVVYDPFFSPLLSVLPLQYLAYLLAVRLGFSPDYPKNLAKCLSTH